MCIIILKPANTPLPTWNTLETCFNRNPDGAGFMYASEGLVHIKKGFMSFSEFKKALREEKKFFDFEKCPMVFHFRIKTHGEVSRECCHPFEVSTDLKRLRKTESVCKCGAAHNGVLTNFYPKTKLESDTMRYIQDIVAPLQKVTDIARNDKVWSIITNTISTSKFVILNGDGYSVRFGNGWIEDNGLYYSNGSYKSVAAIKPVPTATISPYVKSNYSSYYESPRKPKFCEEKFKGVCSKCELYFDCDGWGWMCETLEEAKANQKMLSEMDNLDIYDKEGNFVGFVNDKYGDL